MNLEQLVYRRQFIFTNNRIQGFRGWPKVDMKLSGQFYNLLYHPDLDYASAENRLKIHVLGYILDPLNPGYSNQDIVDELSQSASKDEAIQRTDYFNGRFILLVSDNDHIYILNDATGSKQIYYLFEQDKVWIGSTPNLIGEFTKLESTKNTELIDFFENSEFKKKNRAWFGNETPYLSLFSLSPNHLINVIDKEIIRFWPKTNLKSKSLNESVIFAGNILTGTMESASKRNDLHISLTGGWDSRLILSASKKIYKDVKYYTLKLPGSTDKEIYDFLIPESISKFYDLDYHVIELNGEKPSDEFIDVYLGNNVFNREFYASVYHKYMNGGYDKMLNVTGIMGDQVLRAFYRFRNKDLAKKIARRFKVSEYPYTINSIEHSLNYLKSCSETTGINIIDLFNWENYSACWAGIAATEHDIVRDELRVFNCRALISTFMNLPDKLRYKEYPKIYRMIIKYNWPELLEIGIEGSRVQFRELKKIFRRIGIEYYMERVYTSLKELG